MHAYDTGHSRRSRDVPASSSSRYCDTRLYPLYDDYLQPARSRPTRSYLDPEPAAPAAPHRARHQHQHHRRQSVPAEDSAAWPTRRHANVVVDDGPRAAYGSAHPERTSRHDAEATTGARHRQFHEQPPGRYQTDHAAAQLRRAKSHSPRRAARDVATATAAAAARAPSARGRQQYYGAEDAYGRARDYYAYAASPAALPRPPAGDYHAPYRASPLSSAGARSDEKLPGKQHTHAREAPRARTYSEYVEPSHHAPAPRRSRSARAPSENNNNNNNNNHHKPSPSPRGRRDRARHHHDNEDADPYDRRAPRARQRQSVPPPPRARARTAHPGHDEGRGGDHYDYDGARPPRPRRAASAHRGRYGGSSDSGENGDADDDDDDDGPHGSRRAPPDGRAAADAAQSAHRAKQKQWGKQAGKLFMTHAVPVIKQEAVPFLTKAAQAYMQQKAR